LVISKAFKCLSRDSIQISRGFFALFALKQHSYSSFTLVPARLKITIFLPTLISVCVNTSTCYSIESERKIRKQCVWIGWRCYFIISIHICANNLSPIDHHNAAFAQSSQLESQVEVKRCAINQSLNYTPR
jgi:hypothetical protein